MDYGEFGDLLAEAMDAAADHLLEQRFLQPVVMFMRDGEVEGSVTAGPFDHAQPRSTYQEMFALGEGVGADTALFTTPAWVREGEDETTWRLLEDVEDPAQRRAIIGEAVSIATPAPAAYHAHTTLYLDDNGRLVIQGTKYRGPEQLVATTAFGMVPELLAASLALVSERQGADARRQLALVCARRIAAKGHTVSILND